MPLVIADVFSRFPVGEFLIQVNDRKIPEGFYQGIGIDRRHPARCASSTSSTRSAPTRSPRCSSRPGATASRPTSASPSPRSARRPRLRRAGARPRRRAPAPRRGPRALAAVIRAGLDHAPGRIVADLRIARGLDYYTGTVYETQFVGHEAWGSFCSGGRYDALASDGRTTYPGVGISIGVTRLLGLLLGRARLTASRVHPGRGARRASSTRSAEAARTRSRRPCARRGIPCEVAPSAAKFGKQIRYADRRGIPFVWFPAPVSDGDRSRTSAPASRSPPTRRRGSAPPADLRPVWSPRSDRNAGRQAGRVGAVAGPVPELEQGERADDVAVPRRHAPAGSSETLASGRIGWCAMARSAKRSRSSPASMKRCAAPRAAHEADAQDEPERRRR